MKKKDRRIWIACLTTLLVFCLLTMLLGKVNCQILHYIATAMVAFTLGMYVASPTKEDSQDNIKN